MKEDLSESDQEIIPDERKVYDAIYGFISFPKEIWEFIDSPHFQRLRNVRQLGCLSWVFPGAIHSRFEHCLGTGHLAKKYITTLIENHEKKPQINHHVKSEYEKKGTTDFKSAKEEAIFTVTLAGILHDIGHGPYSHLFDMHVVKEVNGKQWEHELASLCLIDILYDYVIEVKQKKGEEKNWLLHTKNRVKALIIGKIEKTTYQLDGTKYKEVREEVDNLMGFNEEFKKQISIRPWQFELISNRLTGIDVDKLDYFRRDAYYLGAKNIYISHDLLMNETLVLKDNNENQSEKYRLCYPSKYSDYVYDVYYSRYKLFKTYYSNLKSNGVDLMLAEVLVKAKTAMKIQQACQDLLNKKIKPNFDTGYNHLTDSILQRIQLYEHEDEGIEQAKKILQKLKRRDIYDFICEHHKHYSFDEIKKGQCRDDKKKLNQLKKRIQNKHKEFILKVSQLGFGIKDKDPLEQCRFYDKTKKIFTIQKNNKKFFSMLKPGAMLEVSVRLYVKERQMSEKKRSTVIHDLYEQMCKLEFISGERGTKSKRKDREEQEAALEKVEVENLRQEVDEEEKDSFS